MKYHFGGMIATELDPYGGVRPDCRFLFSNSQAPPPEVTLDRLDRRRSLLGQFDQARRQLDSLDRVQAFTRQQERAFSMATSPALREAMDIARESMSTRERYGMTLFGQSCLLDKSTGGWG